MARFSNLRVYAQAREVLHKVIEITEDFQGFASLKDQIRRAGISIVSNICEGSEHGADREFRRFLTIAKASAGELMGQIIIARDCRLIVGVDGAFLVNDIQRLIAALGAFARTLDDSASRCRPPPAARRVINALSMRPQESRSAIAC